MYTLNAFGSTMLVVWVALSLVMVAVVATLTVKDFLEDMRRAKAAQTGFPWAAEK